MRPQLTAKAQREIERMWEARHEAVQLLGLVVAEWKSDPMSVACFDSRTVARAKQVVAELEQLERSYPTY
jgi:hypothetical protein